MAQSLCCPRCGESIPKSTTECPYCGIVIAKYMARCRKPLSPVPPATRDNAPSPSPDVAKEANPLFVSQKHTPAATTPPHISRSMLVAGSLGVLLSFFWLSNFVLQYFFILVHEAGHTAASWALAMPAIPALDFMHGGGQTLTFQKSWLLRLTIYAAWFGFMVWGHRARIRIEILVAGLIVYAGLDLTRLGHIVVTMMGHGTEWIVIVALVFFAFHQHPKTFDVNRALAMMLATWGSVNLCKMGWGIFASPARLAQYKMAKGGTLDMDLDVLHHAWGMSMETLGLLFALISLACIPAGYLLVRHRDRIHDRLGRILFRHER